MRFKADEIASVIQQEIEQYRSRIDVRQIGRVIEVGDGMARIYGLSGRHGRRDGRVSRRRLRPGLQPRRELGRRDHAGRLPHDQRGGRGPQHRPAAERAGGRRRAGAGDRPAGQSPGRPRPDRHHRAPAGGIRRPRHRRPPAGEAAAANRHQGHRRDDAHRPRAARVDHRRPQDRQDRHLHRHDHQPEALRREVLLRGHRPEGIDRRRPDRDLAARRGDGLHHGGDGRGERSGAAAIHRPLCRLRHGRILHVQGPARPDHLRRPLEAGPGLSATVAADAAAAGTRGLSGRHFLRPQPACWSGRPS